MFDTSFPKELRRLSDFKNLANESDVTTLRNPRPVWGGYGATLIHGKLAGQFDGRFRSGERLRLVRSGPFMPPVTFPHFEMLVSDKMKSAMEASGFLGVSFREVSKTHIPQIDWHEWDLQAENPRYYPKSGEPEDYLFEAEHSDEAARDLGTIWEVVMLEDSKSDLYRRGGGDRRIYISPRAAAWFQEYFERWTRIRKLD
ncbi:MAG TPA: hypothetical protein VMM76_18805 [Pirellulaceae bacterium]|nr:hypothetical protein [Pirellulaceae bacterium]